MKVASNRLKHLIEFYHSELAVLFDKGEIDALAATALEHYLGYKRGEITARLEENLNQSDLLKLYDCCKLLKTGKPLQYIFNEAWFYNLKLFVNEAVLIPRPETEELVHMVIKRGENYTSLLDIGTGSGCIPVSIKNNIGDCRVSACDISTQALQVAKKNAEATGVDVHYFEADVLNNPSFIKAANGTFDVLISNPPYIKESEKNVMHKNVLEHEPHLALFVNDVDEIIFYKKIIDASEQLLNKGGFLYFELNPVTANDVKAYAQKSNLFETIDLLNDMSGKLRFMKAKKHK